MNDVERKRTQKAVEAEAAARSTRAALGLLAGELGVDLRGLDADQQNVAALRFVLDGRVSAAVLQQIVDDVKRAEGTPGGTQVTQKDGAASRDGKPAPEPPNPSAHPEDESGVVGSESADARPSLGSKHPAPSSGYRFNSTEATEAKMRARLATVHRLEDARTALSLAPRRPERLHPSQVHDACLIAVRDGGTTCSRCSWLMEDDPYTDAHIDDADDRGAMR